MLHQDLILPTKLAVTIAAVLLPVLPWVLIGQHTFAAGQSEILAENGCDLKSKYLYVIIYQA